MPELPEAETIRRGLEAPLGGRTILRIYVRFPDLLAAPPPAFRSALEGRHVHTVGRRGKNVVLGFSDSGGQGPDLRLVVNLGMSGRLVLRERDDASEPPSHPGVEFELDGGGRLIYHDIRRFGRLRVLEEPAFREWSDGLGPEPLSRRFTAKRLMAGLSRSGSPVRSWLLDQRRIAGVGNIYANEALFGARVHPRTAANRLSEVEVRQLHRALRRVLRAAIRAQGTTFQDYRTALGSRGSYASRLRVYGREGRPCSRRCGAGVERLVFGNRSAFLCPRCQPEPDLRE